MKKILFVFNHPAPYKVRFFNELAKHCELTVLFERDGNRNRNKTFYSESKINFNAIFLKSIKLGEENSLTWGIKNHIKKNKYDLIVMNGYSNIPEMIALDCLKRKNIPYVFYINGGIINKKENKIKRSIKKHYIQGASYYISPDNESNNYLKFYGADSEIYNYPYSTIYESQILTKKLDNNEMENIKKELNVLGDEIYISVGQLIKRKNYLKLVELWKNQPKKSTLLIAGEGKQKQEILDFIKENNIENVQLIGYKSKDILFKYFQISKAFIFPSNEDIYGHVINEALSQGLPVISTSNVNSARKLIKNGFNGYLLENLTQDELDAAIKSVKTNDLFDNCIATAKDNTIEKMVEAHLKIFNNKD